MRATVQFGVVLLLSIAVFGVYRVRTVLGTHDATPEINQRYQAALESIPLALENGKYRGEALPETERVVEFSGADFYASALYHESEVNRYRLWIGGTVKLRGYFHQPSGCLPYRGWEILEDSLVPFSAFATDNPKARMRRLSLERNGEHMLVYYWFQCDSHVAADEWATNYFRFLDLLSIRSFRAMYIVSVYAPVHGDMQAAEEQTNEFLKAVGPHIQDAIAKGREP